MGALDFPVGHKPIKTEAPKAKRAVSPMVLAKRIKADVVRLQASLNETLTCTAVRVKLDVEYNRETNATSLYVFVTVQV